MDDGDTNAPLDALMQEEQSTAGKIIAVLHHLLGYPT